MVYFYIDILHKLQDKKLFISGEMPKFGACAAGKQVHAAGGRSAPDLKIM